MQGLLDRIAAGEFDADGSFHRFVAKEVYPLLSQGTLTLDDLIELTRQYAARKNPHIHWMADLEKGLAGR